MSKGSADYVTIDLQHKLDALPCEPLKPSIHRLDTHLRSGVWDNIYDPEMLSFGPYHHGNSRLQAQNQIKYTYFKRLLKRRNDSVDRYVTVVSAMESRARKCYADPIKLDRDEFVALLVVDGIFLIELLRSFHFKNLRDENDLVFSHERVVSQLRHDIFLLENQIPFFILNELFNMTKTGEDIENSDNDDDEDLIKLALGFVDGMLAKNLSVSRVWERLPLKNIDHLFGLIHGSLCLPFVETISPYSHNYYNDSGLIDWSNINSVSGLRVAGIKFRKGKEDDNFMHIKFANGVVTIPQLRIFDETESQLRNLIAYEQYFPDGEKRCVSDYTFIMHCLIKTSNDVEFLRCRGIIENCLGPDEEVCRMFNRLGKNILISSDFCYAQVFCSVNRRCRRRAKRWKANLRRNYLYSPWAIISSFAAVALLILTFTQTTYTVLTYYNRQR